MSELCDGNTHVNAFSPPYSTNSVKPGVQIAGPVTLADGNTAVFKPAAGPDFGPLHSGINVA